MLDKNVAEYTKNNYLSVKKHYYNLFFFKKINIYIYFIQNYKKKKNKLIIIFCFKNIKKKKK